MTDGIEIWSGGVNTWECDEMGHLNVRFWVAKALEALGSLAATLGMPQAFSTSAGATLLLLESHMRFLKEARAGASLWATGGVIAMGETDARILIVMRHPNGDPAATFNLMVSHATADDLRPFAWPKRIREAAEGLMIQVPDFAAARSLDLGPIVKTQASADAARRMGLTRIGLGTIQAPELDVFGRMRGEMVIGRISDGVARLFGETRPGPEISEGDAPLRIGGAVLEYRVLYHAWPRGGDHVEVLSGLADCTSRIRRVFHWVVDPVSGRPWASAEAVVISFDLDARKVVDISEAAQAEFRKRSVPGLGL